MRDRDDDERAAAIGALPFEPLPGVPLWLLPQRAAFDPIEHCLIVADAHLGKAASFRALGVPVPEAATTETLGRLSALLSATAARRLVFLGDLLHAARGRTAATLDALAGWRRAHAALAVTLVRGNHDAGAGDPPADLGFAVVDAPLRLGPWALVHEPEPVAGAYAIAGHVHPCVVLDGRARDRLRLPCFHFGPALGVLPAFGAFTGMHALARGVHDRVWAIAGDRVVAVAGGPAQAGEAASADEPSPPTLSA